MKQRITKKETEFKTLESSSMCNLKWECRYSHDDQPDKYGRWARKCFFKDRHIAWVNRLEFDGVIRFCVNTQFPVNGNDMPHYCSHFETFKEAKECVEHFWGRFILVCHE